VPLYQQPERRRVVSTSRIQPGDDPAEMIDHYVAVNNLGTTSVLRAFAPLLRDGARLLVVASRAGSLRMLAPVLHARFDGDLESLGDVDSAVCTWRDAVRQGAQLARRGRRGSTFPQRSARSLPCESSHGSGGLTTCAAAS
jgi:NAD(P)-dependent dehydrogenase (short-subunit alcohol dehydrogenase family)